MFGWLRRHFCRHDYHKLDWPVERFCFCTRPECTAVFWWNGKTRQHVDLDICNTEVYDVPVLVKVQ